MAKPKKRKGKIKIAQRASLVHRNDATRVAANPDTTGMKRVQGRPPASVAPVFRVKVRKKQ